MKRKELERWGVTPLDERELLCRGGGKLKRLLEAVDELLKLVEKAEKYWPNFKEGFKKGWEKA
ncbi:MAG: hypothetical protein PHV12_01560 [Bacteroidales bacterium]|jgi:hypothetical protein|nr:hypothetical protein [Bacteroidales bacterium]MDD3272598.1 hypothetical protein [Bacteroidales bacterium]MDD4057417.1 hypothetical protein [Bacteroidales bacterium]